MELFQQTFSGEPQAGPAVAEDVIRAAKPIRNHTVWIDTAGNPISCHDGGITRVGDTFYWYGDELSKAIPRDSTARCHQARPKYTDVQNGFNCYSSKNLVDWKYEGVCMQFPKDGWLARGTSHRPNVLYNDKTGKYVLWFFCIGTTEPQYPAAMLAIAIADNRPDRSPSWGNATRARSMVGDRTWGFSRTRTAKATWYTTTGTATSAWICWPTIS